MTRAVLALGANLGDARAQLSRAVDALVADPRVRVDGVSSLWRTAAVGGPQGQPEYRNAVVLLDTELTAPALLELAHELERAAGRQRSVRWGPRTLDVDLLAHDELRRADPELSLPHPRAHERAFVLLPWAELEPAWVLAPLSGEDPRPVAEWAVGVSGQQVAREAQGRWWA